MPVLSAGAPNLTHWCIPSFCHAVVGISAENTAQRPQPQFQCLSSTMEKYCPKSNIHIIGPTFFVVLSDSDKNHPTGQWNLQLAVFYLTRLASTPRQRGSKIALRDERYIKLELPQLAQ
jgi:hypothetical protein